MKEIITDKVVWFDIVNPQEEELQAIQNELKLPTFIIDELRIPSSRDKMKISDQYAFIILFFPMWNEQTKTSEAEELDIIMDKKHLVTIRYSKKLEPLNEFLSRCEGSSKSACAAMLGDTTYKTFYSIMKELLEFSNRQLKHIEQKIVSLEDKIFSGPISNNLIFETLEVKRDLLDFKRIYLGLHSCLNSFEYRGTLLWGEEVKIYLFDLKYDNEKVWNSIEHFTNLLSSLESSMYALIDNKINSLTRIYTILSFITWPTLLIISWYQTNVKYLPFIGIPFDAYIVVLIAFIPSILIYIYLKRKKLL